MYCAFTELNHGHAVPLIKMIYQTLMIIGSYVTGGTPRDLEHGMFQGRLVKYPGLLTGVSFTLLTPSPTP